MDIAGFGAGDALSLYMRPTDSTADQPWCAIRVDQELLGQKSVLKATPSGSDVPSPWPQTASWSLVWGARMGEQTQEKQSESSATEATDITITLKEYLTNVSPAEYIVIMSGQTVKTKGSVILDVKKGYSSIARTDGE